MKDTPPVVYVVDDDPGIRAAIQLLLRTVGIASMALSSARDFLAAYDPSQPGCLLLDIRMPDMSGIDLQRELNGRGALLPLIFITGHGDVPMAVEAMQHGAFDFLQKPFRDQDLIDCIHEALARDQALRLARQRSALVRERMATLTTREREVLNLMTQGKQNKVMAATLGLSQRTVEIHRSHVMKKLQATSVASLVRMVVDAGLA